MIKKYVRLVGNILTVLSFVFIIYALLKMDFNIDKVTDIKALVFACFFGIILSLAALCLLPFGWKIILEYLGNTKPGIKNVLYVYMKANIGKYIPGNVAHFVQRNLLAVEWEISQVSIALSTVIENILLLLTAIILSLVLMRGQVIDVIRQVTSIKTLTVFIIIIIITGFGVLVLLKKYSEKLKQYKTLFSWGFLLTVLKVMLFYTLNLMIQGMVLVIICKWGLNCNLLNQQMLTLSSCYIVAWMAGYCIPGAPGGIGVREFVMIILMTPLIGDDIIAVAAVLQRCVSLCADIIGYVLAVGYSKLFRTVKLRHTDN